MTIPSVDVIFCEDVRQETGNKSSYIGVFNGNVIFPGPGPLLMPKLVVLARIQWPFASPPEGWSVQVTLPNNSDAPDFVLPPEDADKLVADPDTGLISIALAVQIAPFVANTNTKLSVRLRSRHRKKLVGILRFNAPSDGGEAFAP